MTDFFKKLEPNFLTGVLVVGVTLFALQIGLIPTPFETGTTGIDTTLLNQYPETISLEPANESQFKPYGDSKKSHLFWFFIVAVIPTLYALSALLPTLKNKTMRLGVFALSIMACVAGLYFIKSDPTYQQIPDFTEKSQVIEQLQSQDRAKFYHALTHINDSRMADYLELQYKVKQGEPVNPLLVDATLSYYQNKGEVPSKAQQLLKPYGGLEQVGYSLSKQEP